MNDSANQKLNLFEPDSIELELKGLHQGSPREIRSNHLGMTRNPSGFGTPSASNKFSVNFEDKLSINGWNESNEQLLKYDGLDESSDAHNMILCHSLAKSDMATFNTYMDKMRHIGS